MGTLTNQDRVLEVLRVSSLPLDDDQLSERAGVRPRQAVNQICRALAQAGVVRRYPGVDGKVVNEVIGPDGPALARADAPPMLVATVDEVAADLAAAGTAGSSTVRPGNSQEQREAERVMLDRLSAQLGMVLEPATVRIPSGARVMVDGADRERTILVECWAHQGRPKSAQRHKVLADAFKLTWIARTIYPTPRLVLCLSDPAAAAGFLPSAKSWAAQALHDLNIQVIVVDLPDEVRQRVQAAQKRQYR